MKSDEVWVATNSSNCTGKHHDLLSKDLKVYALLFVDFPHTVCLRVFCLVCCLFFLVRYIWRRYVSEEPLEFSSNEVDSMICYCSKDIMWTCCLWKDHRLCEKTTSCRVLRVSQHVCRLHFTDQVTEEQWNQLDCNHKHSADHYSISRKVILVVTDHGVFSTYCYAVLWP